MKKIILLFSLLSIIPNNKIIGFCDIKGNVKNPGVYEIIEKDTIKDIIDKAGGLKKNSYTDNINLSKSVTDEMVIYIHSEKEIKKIKSLNNCVCSPTYIYKECNPITTTTTTTTKTITSTIPTTTTKETTTTTTTKKITTSEPTTTILNNKININNCTIEELINLKGLGETKAKNIIEYRNNNGLFASIEDILKVDGIGNKTFENIKEYIEV